MTENNYSSYVIPNDIMEEWKVAVPTWLWKRSEFVLSSCPNSVYDANMSHYQLYKIIMPYSTLGCRDQKRIHRFLSLGCNHSSHDCRKSWAYGTPSCVDEAMRVETSLYCECVVTIRKSLKTRKLVILYLHMHDCIQLQLQLQLWVVCSAKM